MIVMYLWNQMRIGYDSALFSPGAFDETSKDDTLYLIR